MKKKLLCLLFLVGFAPSAHAADIYFAQSSAGSNNGTSCPNAYSLARFNTADSNWTGGNALHLCGTWTGGVNGTMLTIQASGSMGSPITVKFETNAVLTAPYWKYGTGAIFCNGKNFVTIDGGTSGWITNSADGTALTYQADTTAIQGIGCGDFTVKNVQIVNVYIRTADQSSDGGGNYPGESVGIQDTDGNNIRFTGNTIDHCRIGVNISALSGSWSNPEIDHNSFPFNEVPIQAGAGNGVLDGLKIHDNDFPGGSYLWDDPANGFHHEAIHLTSIPVDEQLTNVQTYNNKVHGIWSATTSHVTAAFFSEYIGSGWTLFNNVIDFSAGGVNNGPGNGDIFCKGPGSNACKMYNNTFIDKHSDQVFQGSAANTGHIFTNNISYNVSAGPSLHDTSFATADYNLYYGMVNWGDLDTYAHWQGFGFDAHGINGTDPTISGTTYVPAAGSVANGAGTSLGGLGITPLNSDLYSVARVAWTIGCCQLSSVVGPPPTGGLFAFIYTPGSIGFAWQIGNTTLPAPVAISVGDTAPAGVHTPFTASSDQPWLKAAPSSGQTATTLMASLSPTAISAAGSYTGHVTITGTMTNSPVVIPVNLTVSAAPAPLPVFTWKSCTWNKQNKYNDCILQGLQSGQSVKVTVLPSGPTMTATRP